MTPNHLGTLNVDGESLPGKADLIVGYIFKHINYESVGVSWGASWLSLTFRSLVINDLSLNPAVTAKRLKVTLTLPAAKWLFQVSTFFKGGVGFGYGVLDAEVEDLKVKVKTGGVEVRTYPLVTVTSSTDREYEVEPVMYPTNLHPFILKLPPFPTEPTFFKIGAMDARDIEITLENRKRTLHRNLYQIPEYLTNVTKVNRHGTDEWEGIDAADFPILVKKDIGAVFENLVGSLNDWEDVKIVMRRGAEWARSVVKDGGDGVIAAYGVGRRAAWGELRASSPSLLLLGLGLVEGWEGGGGRGGRRGGRSSGRGRKTRGS